VIDHLGVGLVPGQITAIVGPNGAGKSSLLQALAGLLKPAAGGVTLGGEAIAAMPPWVRAQRIGYLPQSPEIAWDVAVEHLVALGRLPWRDRGFDAIEAAIDALALGDLRSRRVSQLSGGERARVLLARVLAGEPRWILADEPLAALDLAHQLALIAQFKACARMGQGVVLVLHDLALAMNHADRVVVLRGDGGAGRIVADGKPGVALAPEIIANAWKVPVRWIGSPGAQALVTGA